MCIAALVLPHLTPRPLNNYNTCFMCIQYVNTLLTVMHRKKVTSTTFWSPQLYSFCVHVTKVQGMLSNTNQGVVEKLLSFMKLLSPFRGLLTSFQKAYKSAYQLRFVVSLILNSHLPLESSLVANARNVAK